MRRRSNYGALFQFCGHLVDAEEIQLMVDAANYCLLIHSAILYGLLEGDPEEIAFDKCVQVVEKGKLLGYVPNEDYLKPKSETIIEKK